jgi:uncharacterized protein with ParB-like and HNH nuclease domain
MKISTVLDHIDSGHMALPEFQRVYVWSRDQVSAVFDSLYHHHLLGGLLVWATESRVATQLGDGLLMAGAVKLLLDDQQRITNIASQTGFRCFTDAKSFRRYLTVEVLAGGAHA